MNSSAVTTSAILTAGAWASGVNLYLTTAALGIAGRIGVIDLPGSLSAIEHPFIIILVVLLYAVEFVCDKVPYVDSAWDSVHTFIRPLGGLALGYMAMDGNGQIAQAASGLLTGSLALESHLTKAGSRAAINTSPEPFTNSAASITEDLTVAGIVYFIISRPWVAIGISLVLILLSAWLIKSIFRFVKGLFIGNRPKGGRPAPEDS